MNAAVTNWKLKRVAWALPLYVVWNVNGSCQNGNTTKVLKTRETGDY